MKTSNQLCQDSVAAYRHINYLSFVPNKSVHNAL